MYTHYTGSEIYNKKVACNERHKNFSFWNVKLISTMKYYETGSHLIHLKQSYLILSGSNIKNWDLLT